MGIMKTNEDLVRTVEITTSDGTFLLRYEQENLTHIYPGMVRYSVRVTRGTETIALFRTNSYEYQPLVPLEPEGIARKIAKEWELALRNNPREFIFRQTVTKPRPIPTGKEHVVVIQGSPRPEGNCSILAQWCNDRVKVEKISVRTIYPDELQIHPCIGCYQCYNDGQCVFDDDMDEVIGALCGCKLLIVCVPVYTNGPPAAIKALIDRCLAYHAYRTLTGDTHTAAGITFAVAGRKGDENFTCLKTILHSFMRNIGIMPAGEIMIDGLDEIRDLRNIPTIQDDVGAIIIKTLQSLRSTAR